MLSQSGLIGTTLAAGLPGLASAAQPLGRNLPPKPLLKIIVTGGHPGDPEYGCGGTIARLKLKSHSLEIA